MNIPQLAELRDWINEFIREKNAANLKVDDWVLLDGVKWQIQDIMPYEHNQYGPLVGLRTRTPAGHMREGCVPRAELHILTPCDPPA